MTASAPEIEIEPTAKSRVWAFAEFALIAFWFVADILSWGHHIVTLSKTINIFLLAWLSLWLRGIGWRGVGLRRPIDWRKTLLLGIGAGLAMEALELFITQPCSSAHSTNRQTCRASWNSSAAGKCSPSHSP